MDTKNYEGPNESDREEQEARRDESEQGVSNKKAYKRLALENDRMLSLFGDDDLPF